MTDEVVDPVSAALNEMRAAGLIIKELQLGPPPGGKRAHRVDVEGQKAGKKAGWYICHEFQIGDGQTIVVGSYGIWEGDKNNAQKLKLRSGAKLDDAARQRLRQRQKQIAAEAEASHEQHAREVAKKANEIWKSLRSCRETAYLKRKMVAAYGLAIGRDDVCVVPLRDSAGAITQLQFISPDGTKRFLTGPGVAGSFHLIGTIVDELPLVFAEGYATAASVHMATGWPVIVCINAKNMIEVAQRLRPIYPQAHFVFAGDDDHDKKVNTGRTVVTEGAKRFRGSVVFPRFNDPSGRTDFNDVHVEQGIDAVREQLEGIVTPSLPASAKPAEEWERELVWNSNKGMLEPMVQNGILVLENHPDWFGVLGYNEFARRVMKLDAPPWAKSVKGPLRDTDEIECAAWFGRKSTYASSIPTSVARQAIIAVAERHAFHPVKDYLSSLVWDKVDRLDTFFPDFCNAPATEWSAAFAQNFFKQAVARIFQPGIKADLMLVLEGEQGARKSSLAQVLAGEFGYADVGEGPSNKDFFQILTSGVWIAEISELASFAKAENAHIKRAISVSVDKYRKSYGHNVEEYERQCVFFGTVNGDDWNKDETGGRRYMPVTVADIDIDAVKNVRDQLWAEAMFRYQAGEPWHVLPEGAKEEQEKRYVADIWTEPVVAWLDNTKNREGGLLAKPRMECTISEVLSYALDMDLKKQDKSSQTRVGNILMRLGWKKKQRKSDGVRVYFRPKVGA